MLDLDNPNTFCVLFCHRITKQSSDTGLSKGLTVAFIFMINKKLLTSREACDFLRISNVTLWRERKAGKITYRRISGKILYSTEDLEQYLESSKRKAIVTR